MKNKLIVFLSVIIGSICSYTYHLPPRWGSVDLFKIMPNGEKFKPSAGQELSHWSYKSEQIERFVSDYFTILEEFLVAQSVDDEKVVIEKFFVLINSLEHVTKKWESVFGEFYKIPPMSTEQMQRNLILVLKEEWRKFVHTSRLVLIADKRKLTAKLTRLVHYSYQSKAYKLFYGFLNKTR